MGTGHGERAGGDRARVVGRWGQGTGRGRVGTRHGKIEGGRVLGAGESWQGGGEEGGDGVCGRGDGGDGVGSDDKGKEVTGGKGRVGKEEWMSQRKRGRLVGGGGGGRGNKATMVSYSHDT